MRFWKLPLVACFLLASTFAASAVSFQSTPSITTGNAIVLVADGCGQGRYRGPGGACHRFGRGPTPGGNFAGSHRGEGCGPGRYRGPAVHVTDWEQVLTRVDFGCRVNTTKPRSGGVFYLTPRFPNVVERPAYPRHQRHIITRP